MPFPANVVIDRTTPADVKAINDVSGQAFISDVHSQLKAQKQDKDVATWMVEGCDPNLKDYIENRTLCDVFVARDRDAENKVVGSIVWVKRGYYVLDAEGNRTAQEVPPPPTYEDAKSAYENAKKEWKAEDATQTTRPEDGQPRTVAGLEASTNASMQEWIKRFMPPGTRCRFIMGISVHPSYAGKGVGSALMRAGTELADKERAWCWVHSSMKGAPSFEKNGFEEVGRIELDLDEFAQGDPDRAKLVRKDGDGKWGRYAWRYMTRGPLPS